MEHNGINADLHDFFIIYDFLKKIKKIKSIVNVKNKNK